MDTYIGEWSSNFLSDAVQQSHDECVLNPDSCHSSLAQMYKDSQSDADRKQAKADKDANDETPLSMEAKMKSKSKNKSLLDGIDAKWLVAGALAIYLMRR